jgi:hypothetical protein
MRKEKKKGEMHTLRQEERLTQFQIVNERVKCNIIILSGPNFM